MYLRMKISFVNIATGTYALNPIFTFITKFKFLYFP